MKIPYNLEGMIDKQAVAEALGLIDSNDYFMATCTYHSNYVLYENGEERPETLGHTFSAMMVFDDDRTERSPEFSFTDLDGDLRLVLAGEIEKRANAMLTVATALRQHHADEEALCDSNS